MDRQTKQEAQFLLLQWLEHKTSEKQEAQLFTLLEREKAEGDWEELLEELMVQEPELANYDRNDWSSFINRILRPGTPVRRINNWKKWVAAAAILFLLGAGTYWLVTLKENKKTGMVQQNQASGIPAPNITKAKITTSTGDTIFLDHVSQGMLFHIDGITVQKLSGGRLAYNSQTATSSLSLYHTLSNPRGSTIIDVTLSDGSRVWLNAGSSLSYPVVFSGNERKVLMTGEAYFEVAPDVAKPFYVTKGNISMQVLGTKFNVNSYDDEDAMRVTLLEGSVKVSESDKSKMSVVIRPGEQAVSANSGQLTISKNIDVEEVMAWKNGKFQFGEKMDIQRIMRQIARWYDVEVEYRGYVNGLVGGSISREANVSKVIEMLEKTGEVKFRIEGKKIIVVQ